MRGLFNREIDLKEYDRVIIGVIEQEHCLHCGNCMTECPVGAAGARHIRGLAGGII